MMDIWYPSVFITNIMDFHDTVDALVGKPYNHNTIDNMVTICLEETPF